MRTSSRASIASSSSNVCTSKQNADTILANKSILIWSGVERSLTESRSVSLRGNGVYRLTISGASGDFFKLFHGQGEIKPGSSITLGRTGGDFLITVRFNSKENDKSFIHSAKVSFVSERNSKLKSTIPLLAFVGKPTLSLDGAKSKKKIEFNVNNDRDKLKIKNIGSCPTYVLIVKSKVRIS